jgi:hypothetical protein
MGEPHITPVSLRDPTGELSVRAWRDNGQRANLVLNVFVDRTDVDVHLTPGQARLLAETLLAVADIVEATR